MEGSGEGDGSSQSSDSSQKDPKPPATMYFGVHNVSEVEGAEPIKQFYTDRAELMKVLKVYKEARFKVFASEVEAVEFATAQQASIQPKIISTPVAGESCAFKSLKPQEMVKLRKAIEAGNLEYINECVRTNPRYLMTPSDTPTILQEGSRYNALHTAAKHGKVEAGRLILDIVKGNLTQLMYPEEELGQNLSRRDRLIDLYLNMPEKGGGDTPLHLAAKFGHLNMVELLTSQPQVNTEMVNKFGERALDIVGSRAKVADKEVEANIRKLIEGLLVIPIFKEDNLGPSILGSPLPQSECTASSALSRRSSSTDEIDNHSSPVRTPLRSQSPAYRSPLTSADSPGSPLVYSATKLNKTPLSTRRGASITDQVTSPVYLAALLGPVTKTEASDLYSQLRKSNSKQRLSDPLRGLERQCREVANRAGAGWKEYWSFLDEYLDLASPQGLERLDALLKERQVEAARQEQHHRCRELDDEDVFLDEEMGEIEITTKPKVVRMDDMLEQLDGFGLSTGGVVDHSGCDDSNQLNTTYDITSNTSVNNLSPTVNARSDISANIPNSELLGQISSSIGLSNGLQSPVSALTNNLGTLNLVKDGGAQASIQEEEATEQSLETIQQQRCRERRPSMEVKELVEHFSVIFSHALVDSLPGSPTDPEIQEWGARVLPHWENLRRQVNNMRSDPSDRWVGLDYSALVRRVVELIVQEIELEVGHTEMLGIQVLLDRLASFKMPSQDTLDKDTDMRGFRRQVSAGERDLSRLREIQPLARTLVYYMENRSFPEKENLVSVWDILSPQARVSTTRVNKARKFLHSKVFSGSDSSEGSKDDFSWVNGPTDPRLPSDTVFGSSAVIVEKTFEGLAKTTSPVAISIPETNNDVAWMPRTRNLSESSQGSSQYATPPTSPAPSSMLTADEGVFVWLGGSQPTQTDRQVCDALTGVEAEGLLEVYPNLYIYLINLRNYTEEEKRRWPRKCAESPNAAESRLTNVQPRRLDLSSSIME